MTGNGTKFFANKDCQYYPCHDLEEINCLFCFCPLYPSMDCRGGFTLLASGIKDCTECSYPHAAKNYDEMMTRLIEVIDLIK